MKIIFFCYLQSLKYSDILGTNEILKENMKVEYLSNLTNKMHQISECGMPYGQNNT